jgi:DnaJ-domain-containing protein 1
LGNIVRAARQVCSFAAVIPLDSMGKMLHNFFNMGGASDEKDKGKLHKVLGAGIGWIVAGPVGAALGLLVGHTMENNPDLLGKELLGGRLKPYYDVLEVPYDARPQEIKAAYKSLAQKYHPDRFIDTDPVIQELVQGKMTEINEAYARIMDSVKRS